MTPFGAKLTETMIERVLADGKASGWLYGWKGLEREGWEVSILAAPDGKTLVGLAHRRKIL